MSATTEEIVTGLLAAAELQVSDTEKSIFVADYPQIRKAADALYLPELDPVEPSLRFDPLDYYPVDESEQQ